MKLFFLFFFMFFNCFLFSQNNIDTVLLNTIVVKSERIIDYGETSKIKKIKNSALEVKQSLADVILKIPSVYIKQYGVSGLSTISFRGTGASHTGVMWNGVEINMLSTGFTDLNVISTSIFESIDVHFGSNVALTDNGSIGGSINLISFGNTKKNEFISLSSGINQYQGFYQRMKIYKPFKKLIFDINGTYSKGNNEIPLKKGIYDKLPNATTSSINGLINCRFTPSSQHDVKVSIWGSKNERQLPPSRYSAVDSAFQNDLSIRFLTDYTRYLKRSKLSAKIFYDYTSLIYESLKVNPSITENQILFSQFNIDTRFKGFRFNFGLSSRYESVVSNQYEGNKRRLKHSAFVSDNWESKNKKFYFENNLRVLLWGRGEVIGAANVGFKYRLTKNIAAFSKFSYDYKLPSFNDLYWPSQTYSKGNPHLIPEKSLSIEVNLDMKFEDGSIMYETGVSTYRIKVEDWIGWLPVNAVWSPINEKNVLIMGIEPYIKFTQKLPSVTFAFEANYAFIESTVVDSYDSSRNGSFLPYQPHHKFDFSYGISWKKLSFIFNHQIVSQRFLLYNNVDLSLKKYQLGTLTINYKLLNLKKFNLDMAFACQNLYDTYYELQLGNPTLPRNFSASMNLRF